MSRKSARGKRRQPASRPPRATPQAPTGAPPTPAATPAATPAEGTLSTEAAQALSAALAGSRAGAASRPRSVPDAPAQPSAAAVPAAAVRPAGAPAAASVAAGGDGRAPAEGRVELSSWSCSAVDDVEPRGLGMTYWVDVPEQGEPSRVRVRFSGRRVDSDSDSDGAGSFVREVAVGPVPPGAGRIAVTGRVNGVPAGDYEVRAVALDERGEVDRRVAPGSGRGRSTFGPVARALAPGVRPYAWPSMVLLGTVAALVVQVMLASGRDVAAGRLLAVSLLACVLGVLGAKAYYLLTHRGQSGSPLAAGMSIQGFVLVAIGTLVLGSWAAGVPVGDALDVTTPGLLLGMTIGRLGCWFGGCCAGRPTASRWGLWSSDRVLGVRRIPVQFLESSLAGVLAVLTAVLVAADLLDVGGTTFVVGIAGYTLVRQVLFPLRDIPRATRYGRPLVTVATVLAIVAAVVADLA